MGGGGGGDVRWAFSWCGGRNVCDIGKCVVRNKVGEGKLHRSETKRWVSQQEVY